MIRATTTTRIPPLALAAAAGLHVLVGIAVLDLWQRSLAFDEAQPIEIEVVAPAAAPEPAPVAEPFAKPVAAATEPTPSEPQSEPQPEAQSQPEIAALDPAFLPEPEPPPPLVLEPPKPSPPKPAPPRPVATPRPAPTVAPPAALPPALSAPAATLAPAPAAPRADPSYLDRLAAAIERERDYPTHARRQGHQGRVVLHLVIAASGKLLAAHIVTSSGLETLDRAALGMVQRARLPPLGPGFGAESATFTVPIAFAMR